MQGKHVFQVVLWLLVAAYWVFCTRTADGRRFTRSRWISFGMWTWSIVFSYAWVRAVGFVSPTPMMGESANPIALLIGCSGGLAVAAWSVFRNRVKIDAIRFAGLTGMLGLVSAFVLNLFHLELASDICSWFSFGLFGITWIVYFVGDFARSRTQPKTQP